MARRYHQRLNKKADISEFIKAQELSLSRKTENISHLHPHSSPAKMVTHILSKVRYEEMYRELNEEMDDNKQKLIKSHWLGGNIQPNHSHLKANSMKNP